MAAEDILEPKKLVQKYYLIFSKNYLDLGKADKMKFKIKITDSTPFKERYWRIPPDQCEAL